MGTMGQVARLAATIDGINLVDMALQANPLFVQSEEEGNI